MLLLCSTAVLLLQRLCYVIPNQQYCDEASQREPTGTPDTTAIIDNSLSFVTDHAQPTYLVYSILSTAARHVRQERGAQINTANTEQYTRK